MKWLRKIAPRAQRLFDKFPLTFLGVLLLAANSGGLIYFGSQRQDLVLFVAGIALTVLVSACLLLVTLVTLILKITIMPQLQLPAHLEAESPISTGFSLPALSWLPLISLRWHWLFPDGVEVELITHQGHIEERIILHERGAYEMALRRLVVEDVFGLARLALRLRDPTRRTVLPAQGRPFAVPLLEAMVGGDNISHPLGPPEGDLVEMRRYVAGDPMKRVLWKTYARTRALMVRLPERAFAPTRRTLAFLVAGEQDEAAAGIARRTITSQALGADWRFCADGSDHDTCDLVEAQAMLVRSRHARERQGQDLGPFLARTPGNHRLILFVPPRLGPWLACVEHELRRHPVGVEVVIGTDGITLAMDKFNWRRLLLINAPSQSAKPVTPMAEVEEITQRLAQAGANVLVVDRQTGRLIGRPWRRRRV